MIRTEKGFIAWCVLVAVSTTIMCLGVYVSALAREYHDRVRYTQDTFMVEQTMYSCADVALRAIAGRAYMPTSSIIVNNCRVLIAPNIFAQTGLMKIEGFSSTYSSTTVIRYSIDVNTGFVRRSP